MQALLYLDSLSKEELKRVLKEKEFAPYFPLYEAWLKEPEVEKFYPQELRESLGEEKEYFLYNPPGRISFQMSQFLNLPQIVTMEIFLNSWLSYFLEKNLLQGKEITFNEDVKALFKDKEKVTLGDFSLLLKDNFFHEKIPRKERRKVFILAERVREKLNSF